jgi:DNA-binding transcriptional LysR family regulator
MGPVTSVRVNIELGKVSGAGHFPLLIAGDTSHQLELLERGELDMAILRAPVFLSADSEQLELQRDELGVLMAANHPLAACERLSCADLSGEELIWFPRHLAPGFYDATLEALERDGALQGAVPAGDRR